MTTATATATATVFETAFETATEVAAETKTATEVAFETKTATEVAFETLRDEDVALLDVLCEALTAPAVEGLVGPAAPDAYAAWRVCAESLCHTLAANAATMRAAPRLYVQMLDLLLERLVRDCNDLAQACVAEAGTWTGRWDFEARCDKRLLIEFFANLRVSDSV
jgi:hypothetical protein